MPSPMLRLIAVHETSSLMVSLPWYFWGRMSYDCTLAPGAFCQGSAGGVAYGDGRMSAPPLLAPEDKVGMWEQVASGTPDTCREMIRTDDDPYSRGAHA